MAFEEILAALYRLQYKIAQNHPSEKADLFIEFLKQKRELENQLKLFKEFTEGFFKEELDAK